MYFELQLFYNSGVALYKKLIQICICILLMILQAILFAEVCIDHSI